jgi:23S rRNA pseudouridine1911/1915/1917 synthase
MPDFKVPDSAVKERLDLWLTQVLALPRGHVQRLIKDGKVTVKGVPQRSSYGLRKGDLVLVELPEATTKTTLELDLPTIYEDGDVVVIDKPAGLMVHPARQDSDVATVVDFIRSRTSDPDPERPGIAHRLDSDTSGVLVLAKTATAKAALQTEFREHRVEKTYLALVIGRLKEEAAVIRLPLARSSNDPLKRVPTPGGKEAETTYRLVQELDGYSLIEVKPKTGRTHQIRAHMAAIGHPIAGDRRYGGVPAPRGLKRQFLHALSIRMALPSGRTELFEALLADDLTAVLESIM